MLRTPYVSALYRVVSAEHNSATLFNTLQFVCEKACLLFSSQESFNIYSCYSHMTTWTCNIHVTNLRSYRAPNSDFTDQGICLCDLLIGAVL